MQIENKMSPLSDPSKNIFELIKCFEDPAYFIQNYVKINNFVVGIIPFILRTGQKEWLKNAQEKREYNLDTIRREGTSSLFSAYILWSMIFKENFRAGVIGCNNNAAADHIEYIRNMFEQLPDWIRNLCKVESSLKTRFELENGSRVHSYAVTANILRGQSFNLVYFDQFRHAKDKDRTEFMRCIRPVIASDSTSKFITVTSG